MYRSLYSRCVAVARAVVGNSNAEDVAQEAFVRLLEYRCGRERLRASYIFRVVRNVALNMKFSGHRSQAVSRTIATPALEPKPAPDMEISESWVHDVIADLGANQHAAIMLTEARGLTEVQAGLALGLARTTVGATKRTVIETLRSRAALRNGKGSHRSAARGRTTHCA